MISDGTQIDTDTCVALTPTGRFSFINSIDNCRLMDCLHIRKHVHYVNRKTEIEGDMTLIWYIWHLFKPVISTQGSS